jgi:hypothetical protein
MKTISKKTALILLILLMTMSLPGVAAAQDAVTVSIRYGDFDTSGDYIGSGNPNANFYIQDYSLDIDHVQLYVDYSLKQSYYLPSGEPDPLNGDASVLDAIIVTFLDKGFYSIYAGWDDVNIPNGGYISNVSPQTLTYNVTYYEGENGNKWGHATGTGWNVAYTQDGVIQEAEEYTSNIALTDDMEIVFDVSAFDRHWDTGEPW